MFIDTTGFHKSHKYHSANRAAVIMTFVVFIQQSVTAQGQITVNSQTMRNTCIISGDFLENRLAVTNDASMAIRDYATLDCKIFF